MCVSAQNATIKGQVVDTLNKQNLHHAVVSLLHSKDSVLYKFTRTLNDGSFAMQNLKQGKYVLLVSYPSYADYFDTLTLAENTVLDLGKVMATTKAHLLSDVRVVSKIAAVRMKGDTIVYKADSFKVRDGANVEELLKKFPGIQVDKSGNITAMGTKVEKVLVDGEEFFGDDPTVATKNLDAKMVNEVQVFDKKSDQATFTGVDDGNTTRTINLKLKDDAKKGWFGKIEASGGLDDRWNNTLMANSFKKKRKFSLYGIASSTGKTGLDWDEQGKFGDGNSSNFGMSDDGGMYMTWGGGDGLDNSNYWGEGIPKSWSAGINYSNKYNNDKQSLNGSYKYIKLMNEGAGSTVSQTLLPDSLFFSREKRTVFGNKDRHSVNGSFDWMIDSMLSAKLTLYGAKGETIGYSRYENETTNVFNQFVNKGLRVNNSKGDNQSLKMSLLIRKRFKKVGRTISFTVDQNLSEINNNTFLLAQNDFYNKNATYSYSDTTDQNKLNYVNKNVITSRLSYTEQLAKNTTLEVAYGYSINKSENRILSYDKNLAGVYNKLNTKFSNDYDFNVVTNKLGASVKYNYKKLNFSAGGDLAETVFKQTDLIKDSLSNYTFKNIFPRATFTYKFNPNKRISINYNGNSRQPSIQQIQPVADNSNPLFVQVGNQSLKQEFNNNIRLNFNNYKVLKNRGYWIGLNYNSTSDAIRSNQFTDTVGKTTSQYINIAGNYNYGGNMGYNFKVTKYDIYFNFNYNFNQSHNVNFVNGQKNTTIYNRHSLGANIGKDEENKYNIWLWSNVSYNSSTSSIQANINSNYWSFDQNLDATIQLPWKMEFNTSIQFEIRQKTALFSNNNNVTVWNSYLAKKILKNQKGQIRFSAFDILDQNRGYDRSITSTNLSENTYQQLAQYFLLSFIWNFSKGGAALQK